MNTLYLIILSFLAKTTKRAGVIFLLSILILSNTTGSVAQALSIDRSGDYLVWHDDVCKSGNKGGSALPGNNNAEKAYNFLVAHGYEPHQAAGIVGNMILESGVGPERLQNTSLNTRTPADQVGDKNTGWGIVQWTPGSKYIKAATGDPNSLDTQLNYLVANDGLNGGASAPEVAAQKVREAGDVDSATQAFGQYYEAPADLGASIAIRKQYAQAIYEQATKGTPLPEEVASAIVNYTDSAAGASTQSVSNTSKTKSSCKKEAVGSDCKNPFRDLSKSQPRRFDGGLDYGGAGEDAPVYATCPGKVTLVQTTGSGWPGLGTNSDGAYIVVKGEGGKTDGLNIYMTEDCTPKVKEGDTVTTETEICTYKDQGTMLEIGWSEGGNQYIKWSDYPGAPNDFGSNSGQDIGQFLETLGVGPGVFDGEKSNTPPPADWPKWGDSTVSA